MFTSRVTIKSRGLPGGRERRKRTVVSLTGLVWNDQAGESHSSPSRSTGCEKIVTIVLRRHALNKACRLIMRLSYARPS